MSNRATRKKQAQGSRHTAHEDGLSLTKHAAVWALLSSPTVTSAAEAVNVSRRCLHRWLTEPAFRKALTQARHLAVRQTSAFVQAQSGLAAKTLVEVMENKEASAASRVSASRAVLEMTYQLLEADEIAERLERLERLNRGDGDGQEAGW